MYRHASLFQVLISSLFLIQVVNAQSVQTNNASLESRYQLSIEDAMQADSTEICDTLWAIDIKDPRLQWKTIQGTPHVLMGCFTRFPDSYKDSIATTQWGVLWVFIPQQFKKRMKQVLTAENDTLLRIRQLLGLPPENKNYSFMECWVNPADLFRPGADPAIEPTQSTLYISASTDSLHRQWFLNNIYSSYLSEYRHFPWTRLGYTYDWAENAQEIGISEYCVRQNATLRIKKTWSLKEYFLQD